MNNITRQNRARYQGRLLLILSLFLASLLGGVAQAREGATQPSHVQTPSSSASGVVNINTATEEQLVRLPGIGPSKARAILALRTQMGGFSKVENLLRVRGIGRKTLQKLNPMLTLKGETTLVSSKPSKNDQTKKSGGKQAP